MQLHKYLPMGSSAKFPFPGLGFALFSGGARPDREHTKCYVVTDPIDCILITPMLIGERAKATRSTITICQLCMLDVDVCHLSNLLLPTAQLEDSDA